MVNWWARFSEITFGMSLDCAIHNAVSLCLSFSMSAQAISRQLIIWHCPDVTRQPVHWETGNPGTIAQCHETRKENSVSSGAHLFFNSASQFVTRVSGTLPAAKLVSLIRKRRPSGVTSKGQISALLTK